MPHLARITIYPVKSLDGLDLSESVVLPGGALEDDRRFAIKDETGTFVNGKRTDRIHAIRSTVDPSKRTLTLGGRGEEGVSTFRLDDTGDHDRLNAWLSGHFGYAVTVVEAPETGFPDDTDSPGPTVIALATLEAVSGWFEGLDANEARGRFRANLEVDGVEAFWDDRLYAGAGETVRFRVGEAVFEGVNPCQRCVVPSRSPESGKVIPGFQKAFAKARRETLPSWAEVTRFNHFYRLAVNTRRPEPTPATIRVGDPVEILRPANQTGPAHV